MKEPNPYGIARLTEARIADTVASAKKVAGNSKDRVRESQKARERTRKLIEESLLRRKA